MIFTLMGDFILSRIFPTEDRVKLSKLFAVIERETYSLIMLRDSLQRKKQELEILRTSGVNGVVNVGHRQRQVGSSTALVTQQKRKK